jgi:membrane associated rhomboid family serine protease
MGIYDRDYERENVYDDSPGFHLGSSLSWTTKLVIVMFVVYGVQLATQPAQPMPGASNDGWFTDLFSLHADVIRQPWRAFEFLTYGFLHDVHDLKHILFNMFGLWMFGRIVEQRYGPHEFLLFFLAAVIFAGVCWLLSELVMNRQIAMVQLLGASGGIAAVLILFCFNFPQQQIYLYGLLGMPAWVFAILFLVGDMLGASGLRGGNVAYTAHLGGALFAFIYYRAGWRFTRFLGTNWKMPKLGRRPSLRVLDPGDEQEESTEEQVDNILRKIREQGQDSLTRGERRILEEASREYQRKRQ